MPTLGRVEYHDPGSADARILIDAGGVAGRRIDPRYRSFTVALDDARTMEPAPVFEHDGLCFVEAPCCLHGPGDLEPRQSDYERELADLLQRELGAQQVVVFDHTLRAEGESLRPPSFHVHCDYTARSAAQRLSTVLGEDRAAPWLRGHFAIVNVWRPLVYPVERSPLGFVLPRSVAPEHWLEVEIVFPHRRGQILGLAHDPGHRWIYLDHMRPEEAALFCVYDNTRPRAVPHAAVALVDTPAHARPRQSIESRAFVRFA